MERFDVLVVGAGPTGSAAAKECVDGGLSVLQIDKRGLPRRKACSGIITNQAQNYVLENFGPIPTESFGKPFASRGMAFYFPSAGPVFVDADCYSLYVWRDRFDHFLALASGSDLRDETRLVSLAPERGKVRAVVSRNGKSHPVEAGYVVGADGAFSATVRHIAPEVHKSVHWMTAVQKYYEGSIDADERYLYWILARGLGPFPWLNIKDGQIIIGLASNHGEPWQGRFSAYLDWLRKNLGLSIKRELATEGCMANAMAATNRFFPGRGRVLIAGDAMGLMHQGGEGISCGLASGGLAGQAILESRETGKDALALYKRLVRPEMVTSLDQFNPLRVRQSATSTTVRNKGWLKGLDKRRKAMAARDLATFVAGEFRVPGMLPAVAENVVRRTLTRDYRIRIFD